MNTTKSTNIILITALVLPLLYQYIKLSYTFNVFLTEIYGTSIAISISIIIQLTLIISVTKLNAEQIRHTQDNTNINN